ncbi:MAG: type II toxin-antitoxin system RelE/ParE family toxin [Sphingomonas sp.]|uniref:type II toxin-antitoxin system RelE/ParE family toxin n=1 Tax=Sphingomonas sp. TaxID=28214 RepID=UPI001B1D5B7C|nr:type II toxin-antitoxin system RelE/ParE family toxin [Sphingomonas sp.]MBO9623048.1 type II toxin-antitoxin system RelE/ParE family toxin [Sphingomonas sp.]
MKPKPLRILPQAQDDIAGAVAFYRHEAGGDVALRLVEAVAQQLEAIAQSPGLGSLRYAVVLRIDGLRCARPGRFPYLLFYLEGPEEIQVWRMLHNRRDIPATLQESD